METKKFAVEGLNCGHCVRSLTELIEETPGSSNAQVSLENKSAEFSFAGDESELNGLVERAKEEGFTLSPTA